MTEVFRQVLEPIEVVLLGYAVARLGHIWIVTQATAVYNNLGAQWVDGQKLPCHDEEQQVRFCVFRAAAPKMYPLFGWLVQETGSVYSTTDSHPVLSDLARGVELEYGSMASNVTELHDRVAANALAWRWGSHPSEECTLCCHKCLHRNQIDLSWILRDLLPQRLDIVNIGCQNLGTNDPTHSLIRNHKGQISGVCLDIDIASLAKADMWLRSLGQKTRDFLTVADFVTPDNASHWLLSKSREHMNATELIPTAVLKVDIDTLDDEPIVAETLRALTMAGQPLPLVLVVEYDSRIPPPFRYRCLRTTDISFPPFYGCQPSLSYWVEFLAAYRYFLFKASDRDLVFLEESLAHAAAQRDKIILPLDEVACYLQRAFHRPQADLEEALSLLQHKMDTEEDVALALDRILHTHAPVVPGMTSVSPRYSLPFEVSHPACDLQAPVGQEPSKRLQRQVRKIEYSRPRRPS